LISTNGLVTYYKDCCACRNVLRYGFKFLPFFLQAVNEMVQFFFVGLYSLYAGKVHN